MLARVLSAALSRHNLPWETTAEVALTCRAVTLAEAEAFPVEVEVNCGWGDTVLVIVGLADAAVKESRDRVSTALTNSGFKFPMGRCTINLAPADAGKFDQSFDDEIDMAEVKGQESVKRALEIAAAGGHNVLIVSHYRPRLALST